MNVSLTSKIDLRTIYEKSQIWPPSFNFFNTFQAYELFYCFVGELLYDVIFHIYISINFINWQYQMS